VVIAAAGAVDHEQLLRLTEDRLADLSPSSDGGHPPEATARPEATAAKQRFERKDTEQYHVCLGGLGISRHDDRRFALRVLDTLFGGTSSSRLFQEVRERRGLAYSVYSFTSAYQDTGQVGLYLGTRPENLGQAMAVVGRELERLREDPGSTEEVERAISQHPAVADVVVVGRPSERWGQEVVALVQLATGTSATAEDIIAEAGKHLARYKLPKAVGFFDTIVRSPSGKADYRWAKEQAAKL